MSDDRREATRSEPVTRYKDGEIRYLDLASLEADLKPYLSQGVLWTQGDELPPPLKEFAFRLMLPDGTHFGLRGQVVSRVGDRALIQLTNWHPSHYAAAQAATRSRARPGHVTPRITPSMVPAIARPGGSPQAPRGPVTGPRAMSAHTITRALTPTYVPAVRRSGEAESTSPSSLAVSAAGPSLPSLPPPSGRLKNPVELRELSSLPLRPDGALAAIAGEPSLVALVRLLGLCKATGVLELKAGGERRQIQLRLGRVLVPEQPEPPPVDAATWPVSEYVFIARSDDDLANARRSLGAWNFAAAAVKRLLRDAPFAGLRGLLPENRAPRLRTRGIDLLGALELSPAEQHFAEGLKGSIPLSRLLPPTGSPEGETLRALVLLDLLDFLEWEVPTMELPRMPDPGGPK